MSMIKESIPEINEKVFPYYKIFIMEKLFCFDVHEIISVEKQIEDDSIIVNFITTDNKRGYANFDEKMFYIFLFEKDIISFSVINELVFDKKVYTENDLVSAIYSHDFTDDTFFTRNTNWIVFVLLVITVILFII